MSWRATAVVLVSTLLASCGQDDGRVTLSFDGRDRLLVDEHTDPADGWEMTSGSLFVLDGHGWTGEPDHDEPSGSPTRGTNSAVFRLRSERADLGDVRVDLRFRVERFIDETTEAYDGVHLWLRYRSPDDLYALSATRRDGVTAIKRKEGSSYRTLAEGRSVEVDGRWHRASATAEDVAGGVRLRLWVDGTLVAEAVDRRAPIEDGRVGVRTDDCEVLFDDLVAAPM